MPSLKEVKSRIASVGTTKKITQARQMVSSAQLHHAQGVLENATAYKQSLDRLATDLLNHTETDSPYVRKHTEGPVAIVVMSSNTGMCGSFNANMVKLLHSVNVYYPEDKVLFFPIGKKIREAIEHEGYMIGFEAGEDMDHLAGKTSYAEVAEFVSRLMELYRLKQIKQVDLFYYNYKSMAIQEIREMTLLPYSASLPPKTGEYETANDDFIVEPSEEEFLNDLIPMVIRSNFYYALMENQASEHAARTMAMQLATENADEILAQLQLAYNKLRQQNITSELLDIIGGSFA